MAREVRLFDALSTVLSQNSENREGWRTKKQKATYCDILSLKYAQGISHGLKKNVIMNMTDNSEVPLTISTVALQRRLGVSRQQIYRWVAKNYLIPLPWSRRNKIFNFQDVLTFIRTPTKK